MRVLLLALVALASSAPSRSFAAEDAASPAQGVATVADAAPRSARLPRWGAALGAGFPDFATATLMYRPVSFLRLRAGPAWNTVGWGLQGGVEVVPWSWAVSPLLSVHGGRFLRSNYSGLARGDDASDVKPLLERVDYSYAAVDLGLDLGSPRGFSVALRLGLSFVWVGAHGSATYASDGGANVTLGDPSLSATFPSAKLAVQYWF